MFNKATLVGRLGTEVELKQTETGKTVGKFSLATDTPKGQDPDWHYIAVWDNVAENCEKYLRKGSKVLVEGPIKYSKWKNENGETRYSTSITGYRVVFLDSAKDRDDNADRGSSKKGGKFSEF